MAAAPAPEKVPEIPASAPKPSNPGNECDRVNSYNWDVRIAWAVCMAESRGDPNAANTSDVHKDINGVVICKGSFGLMQISCHHGELYDPAENMAQAYRKYQQRGWQPWGAYTDGRYKKYL